MTRRAKREAIVTLLTDSGAFDAVKDGAARTFDGQSPVAVVLSRGMELVNLSRGLGGDELRHRLSVTLYIRCTSGQEADAEAALDDLVEATVLLLRDAGYGVPGTDAAPADAPLRIVDGTIYRVERIDVTIEEYT